MVNAALLRWVVRLLPARLADWGQAMQAELASVTGPAERLRFVLGCTRAVLTSPVAAVRAGWLLARLAALVLAVVLAATISQPTIRWEALASVAGLVVVLVMLRAWLGPVRAHPAVRLVAAVGSGLTFARLIVTLATLRIPPVHVQYPDAPLDSVNTGAGLFEVVVILAIFQAAVLRVTASRSAPATRTVVVGGLSAVGAAGLWLSLVLLRPAAAEIAEPLLFLLLAAALVAAGLATSGRLVAALLATSGAAWLILLVMDVLPLAGPWVSTASPPSLAWPPPTRIVDTGLVCLIGLLSAVALTVASRRRAPEPAEEPEENFVLELS